MPLYDFAVSLSDQVSGPAKQASQGALALKKSLSELAVAQAQLSRAKSLGDVEGYKRFSAIVDSGTRKVYELQTAATAAKPSVESLGAGAAGAFAGATVAIAATGLALGALGVKAAAMGLEFSQARERAVSLFEALGQAPGAGEKTIAVLGGLERILPQTRGQLVEWTRTLQAAGVTDLGELREQLKATAAASALVGDSGAAAYEKWVRKIKAASDAHQPLKLAPKALAQIAQTGANVSDVAQAMGLSTEQLAAKLKVGLKDAGAFGDALHAALVRKGAGPLKALGLDFDVLKKKNADLIGHLFEGVDASPFTRMFKQFNDQLDTSKTSGKVWKATITGGLSAIFKGAARATEGMVLFGLKTTNAVLRAYIALKPLIAGLEKAAAFVDKIGGGGRTGASFSTPGGAKNAVAGTEHQHIGLGKLAESQSYGVSTGRGFANGLASTAPEAARAGALVAGAAEAGIRKKLVIRSPSAVTDKQGEQTGQGFAGGLARSQPAVERASARIANAPIEATRGALPGGGGNTTNAKTINVGGIHLHGAAGQGAPSLTESGIALMFERLALQQGM